MNYYIQGDAAKADKIKAAFKKLGCDTGNLGFTSSQLYYTIEGRVELMCTKSLQNLIKTHPDYKELALPVEPKFNGWGLDCYCKTERRRRMIKVIEEHPKPVARVRCNNCDSLLEYGNADLHVRYDDSTMLTAMRFKSHFIWCPVCGCEVSASLIPKPEKGEQDE